MSLNFFAVQGRLVRDPMIITAKNGTNVARFTLAVEKDVKNPKQASAYFVPITCYNKQADFVTRFLKKGSWIIAEGKVATGSYVKDGKTIYTLDLIAIRFNFCQTRQQGPAATVEGQSEDTELNGFVDIPDSFDDEEVPFS